MLRRRLRDDGGSVLPLLLVFGLVAGCLAVAGIDVSAAFLARRELANLADGAALAAAQAVDEAALYTDGSGDLPLSAERVDAAVGRYLADEADVAWTARTDGATVTVVVRREVPLPFAALVRLTGADDDGRVPVQATASARAPFR